MADKTPSEEWRSKRKGGWLTRNDISGRLGLAPKVLNDPRAALLSILARYESNAETLYRPITFDEISAHERCPAIAEKLFGDNSDFVLRCFLSDEVRARILASVIAR